MRVALTGASSTGKTTLAQAFLAEGPPIALINVDARAILDDLQVRSTARMSAETYARFQRRYVATKLCNERRRDGYLTERSFVDSFAYWQVHCSSAVSEPANDQLHRICRDFAQRYDAHLFMPYGVVPHNDDGYRHPDPNYHHEISERIHALLEAWNLSYVVLSSPALPDRLAALRGAFRL